MFRPLATRVLNVALIWEFRKESVDLRGHCQKRKKPGFAGILKYERSLLSYRFGCGCVFFEPLAGHLPVPGPMP
jgi:hypothetical protein